MSERQSFGQMNGHAVGIIMKEMVRRALNAIRNQQFTFESQVKASYTGEMDDLVTSADRDAQAVCLKSLRECFPEFGIVGEEDSLKIKASPGEKAYFTIDPLDGTKAFGRRQSHGVGTMLALVDENDEGRRYVAGAYIGDVNTQEIFGYRPGSKIVHRITQFNASEHLGNNEAKSLQNVYAQLREPEHRYSLVSQRLIKRCKNVTVDGGSIGTWMAKLWKQESGIALIPPSKETPWDLTPVLGISQKLGYVFCRPIGETWEVYEPKLDMDTYMRNHELLVVHHSNLDQVI
jgi:fructose-1,6-bisphosphatase/inositol monophosphatase family enzyme